MPKPLKSEQAGDFENVPEGWQGAVLVDVFDLGMVHSEFYGKTQHKVELAFWTGRYKSDDDSVPLIVYQRYTLSAHEKAKLRVHLEQWRGRRFRDEDQCADVELEDVIGKNLRILVAHNESGDRTYANVTAMAPSEKGARLGIPDGFVRRKDREKKEQRRESRERDRRPAPVSAPSEPEYEFPENDYDDDLPF